MDVDGTMTAGGVTLLSQTDEIELKTFDAHGGQGLTLAHTAGLRTGCITGRKSSALLRPAREMHMHFVMPHLFKERGFNENRTGSCFC